MENVRPKNKQVVTPSSYYNITFECSNRAFYNVKNALWDIAAEVGIEPNDGYMDEVCDYEGDLGEIRIYRQDRAEEFIAAVLKFYNVDPKEVGDLDVVLSIF